MKNKKILWVTQTAMLIALIVLAQLLSNVIPPIVIGPVTLSQLITGSLVNLVLIVGAYIAGMSAAGTSALISPILAAFFGIIPGKLPQMIPVVMAGNLVIVFVVWLCFRASNGLGKSSAVALKITGVAAGAVLKAATMWLTTEKIVVPVLHIAPALETKLVALVSVPQLVTAAVGGALALLIMPTMKGFVKGKR
jgi:hypothetical protein